MRTLSVSATSLEREPARLSDLLAEVLAGEGIDLFALETLPRLDEAQALVAMVKGLAPQAECWWVSFQVRSDGARLADGTSLAKAAAWAAQGGDSCCCRHQLRGPRCRLDALHEGGVLLEEGWGYWG